MSAADTRREGAIGAGAARYWPALDVVGSFLSVFCAVHCVATPIVLLALPFTAGFHAALPIGLGTLAIVAVGGGAVLHRQVLPLAPLAPGVGLLALAHSFHEHRIVLSVVASVFLITAHVLNSRACRAACASCPVHAHSPAER